MLGIMATITAASAMIAIEESRAFEKSLTGLPSDVVVSLRKSRQDAQDRAIAERRHKELVEATRNRNSGPFGFILGLICGRLG